MNPAPVVDRPAMATAPVPARLPRCFVWLPLVVGALLLAALYCVFYVAPPEVTMGEVPSERRPWR